MITSKHQYNFTSRLGALINKVSNKLTGTTWVYDNDRVITLNRDGVVVFTDNRLELDCRCHPAVIKHAGSSAWYHNGKRHNLSQPAYINVAEIVGCGTAVAHCGWVFHGQLVDHSLYGLPDVNRVMVMMCELDLARQLYEMDKIDREDLSLNWPTKIAMYNASRNVHGFGTEVNGDTARARD